MVSMMNGSGAMCPATLPEMFMSSLSVFTSPWKTFLQYLMENQLIESALNVLISSVKHLVGGSLI